MIIINKGDVSVELSVEQALELIQTMTRGVAKALLQTEPVTGPVMAFPVVVNGEQRCAPGIISLKIRS